MMLKRFYFFSSQGEFYGWYMARDHGDAMQKFINDAGSDEIDADMWIISRADDVRGLYAIAAHHHCDDTILCKYADPLEGEIIGIDPCDARAVCQEDPNLIYLEERN